jgi:two-component system, cell cycle sensor histidine kinase and response regulator CckA
MGDSNGNVHRIVGVVEDITDRKKLEEQFLRAQRMEAIGTLAGGVAHDLNNILAPMFMISGLLKEKLTSARDREYAKMIETSAQRGAGIVRQLLTFSRGLGGERLPVRLKHLVRELTELLTETFPRNIQIINSIGPDVPSILADPTQVQQVLMNLCVNARDAMPHGGVLRLEAANFESNELTPAHLSLQRGRYVQLSVIDTGEGMPREIVDRIFDPFFTTKPIGKGTGLGLSTVLGIVRSHGGAITVYSEVGKGTAFHVYLPVSDELDEAAIPDAAPSAGHGELILVVDDEAPIRETTSDLLKLHGYQVIAASNGQQALLEVSLHGARIGLLLTDLMMPVMDGMTLIRIVRGLVPGLPVIASSGLGNEEQRAELEQMGITQILRKPYEPNRALQEIAHALARRTEAERAGQPGMMT